jgi:hypothetical protein
LSTVIATSSRGTGGTDASKVIGAVAASVGVNPSGIVAPPTTHAPSTAQSISTPCTTMIRRTTIDVVADPSGPVRITREVDRSHESVDCDAAIACASHCATPKVVSGSKFEPRTVTFCRSTRPVAGSTTSVASSWFGGGHSSP